MPIKNGRPAIAQSYAIPVFCQIVLAPTPISTAMARVARPSVMSLPATLTP